jgi:hypothetical protein
MQEDVIGGRASFGADDGEVRTSIVPPGPLAALDVHPRVAMAILRHSRVALTMEIYTQVPDRTTRDTLKRLSDWLGQAGDEAGPRGAEDGQEDDTSGRPGPRDGTSPDGS